MRIKKMVKAQKRIFWAEGWFRAAANFTHLLLLLLFL